MTEQRLRRPRGRPIDDVGRQERRRQIMEAARRCFLRKGFHATSTNEISQEAGLSVAALYIYFPTKHDLIHDLIEYDLADDLDLVRMVDEAIDPFDAFLEIGLALVRDADTATTTRLRIEIYSEASRDPEAAELLLKAEARLIEALTKVVRKTQIRGDMTTAIEPEDAARLINTVMDGLFTRLALPMDNPERFVRSTVALLRRALRPG